MRRICFRGLRPTGRTSTGNTGSRLTREPTTSYTSRTTTFAFAWLSAIPTTSSSSPRCGSSIPSRSIPTPPGPHSARRTDQRFFFAPRPRKVPGTCCRQSRSSIHLILDGGDEGAQHFDARVVFVVGFHDSPWRVRSAGELEHLLGGREVLIPFGAVAPVFLGQFVGPIGIEFTPFESPPLLFLADLQPELAKDHPERALVRLEFVDLPIGPAPLLDGAEAFDALDQNAPIVAPVEDGQVSGARQVSPEAPKVVVSLFLALGSGVAEDAVTPRVQHLGHALDGPTLAGGVPALEKTQSRHPRVEKLKLELAQADLELGDLLFVLCLGELLCQINLFQHGCPPFPSLNRTTHWRPPQLPGVSLQRPELAGPVFSQAELQFPQRHVELEQQLPCGGPAPPPFAPPVSGKRAPAPSAGRSLQSRSRARRLCSSWRAYLRQRPAISGTDDDAACTPV